MGAVHARRKEEHSHKRTCIGCRRRLPADELLRFNWRDGRLVCVPPGWQRQGRGASVCPSARCVVAALKRNRFRQALRLPDGAMKDVSAHKVLAEALNAYKTRLGEILRSGGPGHEEVAEPIANMVGRIADALAALESEPM